MKSLLLLAAFAASGAAAAQDAPPDPPLYRSAFDTYQPWRGQPVLDWRALNDQMQRLGGHAGHLRTDAAVDRGLPMPADTAARSTRKPAHDAGGHEPKASPK